MSIEVSLRRYEDALLGKTDFTIKTPSNVEKQRDVVKGSPEEIERINKIERIKEAEALVVIRYGITKILGWNAKTAFEYFNREAMEAAKLERACSYVKFPRDLSRTKDFWYIVYKAFPEQIDYNPNKRVLSLYQRLLDGEIKHFPRQVFKGGEGLERLYTLLHYVITNNIPAAKLEDLYEVFGDKAKCNKLLKELQLYYAYKDYFDSPLDFLHHSLGEDGDDFLYSYYQYMNSLKHVN